MSMNCCDINAGMLRTPITLSAKQTTPDGAGGFSVNLASYANVKGHVKAMSGMEKLASERVESHVKLTAVIRYRMDVRASDVVAIDGADYNIVAVYDVEFKRKWLKLDLALGSAA